MVGGGGGVSGFWKENYCWTFEFSEVNLSITHIPEKGKIDVTPESVPDKRSLDSIQVK